MFESLRNLIYGESDGGSERDQSNPFGSYNNIDNFESAPINSFKRRSDGNVYPSTPMNEIQSLLSGTAGKMALGMGVLLVLFALYSTGNKTSETINAKAGEKVKDSAVEPETGPLFWAHISDPVSAGKEFVVNGHFGNQGKPITFMLTTTTRPEAVNNACGKTNPWTVNNGLCFESAQTEPFLFHVTPPTGCGMITWGMDGKRTIAFSEPVINVLFAIEEFQGKYFFEQPFDILSDNSEMDGPGGRGVLEKSERNCGLFADSVTCFQLSRKSGVASGVIRFPGSTQMITFFQLAESKHGMQLGILYSKEYSVSMRTKSALQPAHNSEPAIEEFQPSSPSKDMFAMCELADSLAMPKQIKGWQCDNEGTATLPTCQWSGVTCDSKNRVTGIEMVSKSVRGTVPPSIDKLNMLMKLDLRDNLIDGTIPPNLAKIRTLQLVLLGDNKLENGVPPKMGRLPNLLTLSLNNNSLSGKLPFLFDKPPFQVTNIDLSGNHITGQIPPTFGKISSLKSLLLNGNSLSGSVPYQFCDNAETLANLDLRDNKKLVCIPKCLLSTQANILIDRGLKPC